jgi:hypothetical protein
MTHRLRLLPLLFILWLVPDTPTAQVQPAHEPLTVMSFNIRYGTAPDGDNHWTARRGMLFDLVRAQNADIIGLQEALDGQIREIAAARWSASEGAAPSARAVSHIARACCASSSTTSSSGACPAPASSVRMRCVQVIVESSA